MEQKELSESVIIGITGGIGSGKSVVSRILRLNGFPVYDCDLEAKRIMHDDLNVREKLCEVVGNDVYGSDGCLDSAFMARCIFSDSMMREKVNRIVHRAVAEDFILFCKNSRADKVFCESAILMTSGFYRFCDSILMVDAPEALRIERVVARNGMSREDVSKRIESQKDEFSSLPDSKTLIIVNDGVCLILPLILKFINKDTNKTEIICSEKF